MTTCLNCGDEITDANGECFGHEYAEPGWPVFHTPDTRPTPPTGTDTEEATR